MRPAAASARIKAPATGSLQRVRLRQRLELADRFAGPARADQDAEPVQTGAEPELAELGSPPDGVRRVPDLGERLAPPQRLGRDQVVQTLRLVALRQTPASCLDQRDRTPPCPRLRG